MSCNKEKQTKLWHTVFYENEMKLKQLYVKICCNLPSHGCHVYRVKQLLNERNANKTVVPLLLLPISIQDRQCIRDVLSRNTL